MASVSQPIATDYRVRGPYFVVRETKYNPGGEMWVVHHHGPLRNGVETGNKGGPALSVMEDIVHQIWARPPPALNGMAHP
jgi:hypothetical protein